MQWTWQQMIGFHLQRWFSPIQQPLDKQNIPRTLCLSMDYWGKKFKESPHSNLETRLRKTLLIHLQTTSTLTIHLASQPITKRKIAYPSIAVFEHLTKHRDNLNPSSRSYVMIVIRHCHLKNGSLKNPQDCPNPADLSWPWIRRSSRWWATIIRLSSLELKIWLLVGKTSRRQTYSRFSLRIAVHLIKQRRPSMHRWISHLRRKTSFLCLPKSMSSRPRNKKATKKPSEIWWSSLLGIDYCRRIQIQTPQPICQR